MEKTVGLCALDHYGLIQVQGQEAESFLQAQLTCDLRTLTQPNNSTLGACCNPNGRIQAFFRIFKIHQTLFYLRLPKSMIENTISLFKQYARFSEIHLKEVSEDFIYFGLIAPKADLHPLELAQTLYFRTFGKIERFEILSPKADRNVFDYLEKNFKYVDPLYWEQHEIQALLPEIYPETIEKFLPHHIGLPSLEAISLKKGCYRGQEIIVRMAHRGKIKRGLTIKVLENKQTFSPGALISGDRIVRFAQISPNQTMLLLETKIS